MSKYKKLILIIFILAIFIGVAIFIYKDFNSVSVKTSNEDFNNPFLNLKNDENQTIKNAREENNEDKIYQDLRAKEQIQNIAILKEKIPDLSRPIEIKTALGDETKKETIEKINGLSNGLKKDYDSLEQWLELGLLRKLIGDYDGARDAWKFAALIRPKDAVAFHNLGFLYWQNFKDYKKAEENYLKATENNPKDILAYVDLSNVYYFSLKDASRAKDILNKGLKNNPDNEELKRVIQEIP